MALISKPETIGILVSMLYTYEKAGDELPVHVHDEAGNHLTYISAGSFRCIGNPRIEGKVLTKGMLVSWPVGEPHGFVALEDGSLMRQITTGRTA